MPSHRSATPEHFVPSDRELLAAARRYPEGASLRTLCAEIWPDLAWAPAAGCDSATGRVRTWQAAYTGCGNRAVQKTAAEWLRDELQRLVEAGALRHGHRDRREVDLLASLTFYPVPVDQRRRATP